jgi:hypothetical protein
MGKNKKTNKKASSENYFALKAEVAGSKPARGSTNYNRYLLRKIKLEASRI